MEYQKFIPEGWIDTKENLDKKAMYVLRGYIIIRL